MKNVSHEITIPVGSIYLKGILTVPHGSRAIVVFCHGSGSSRYSPRNAFVAEELNHRQMATLMIDLLTSEEDCVYENRFDIDLLTARLVSVTNFIHQQPAYKSFRIGYFGASTGAASAINAAEILGDKVNAIVSRGGRPDLADVDFPLVKAPTLLIVGSLDVPVIEMNEDVYKELQCEKKLVIVEGATHLFEEEGKLREVTELASDWFQKYLLSNGTSHQKHGHHDV